MKNPTREEELSFYYLYLKNYLASYRFEGVTETMIRARAEKAEETYENARRNGAEVDEAHEMSMAALLEGYRYSEYEIIMDVLEEEFMDDVRCVRSWRHSSCLSEWLRMCLIVMTFRQTRL